MDSVLTSVPSDSHLGDTSSEGAQRMRIGYVLTWSGGPSSGVFKKVVDQVTTWQRLGVDVGVFVATSHEAFSSWKDVEQVRFVGQFSGALDSFTRQPALFSALEAWSPDMAYVRSTPRHSVAFPWLRRVPHIVEVQTDDLAEARLLSRSRYLLTALTRRTRHMHARGLVFVTRELARSPSFSRFTDNRVVIGNGIDLSRVPQLPTAPLTGAPRLAFMGHPSTPWHGLDDVISLARLCPGWAFDLIGPSFGTEVDIPPNVSVHGELDAAEYLPILASADVGIGTLALYRNRMSEASPLKTREYLALGLPVIGAYEDTDIPAASDFFLRLPNEPSSVLTHVDEIDGFIGRWRGQRVAREQIDFLDTSVKEAERVAFMETCLNKSLT